jgi:formylglycine-generating enzyme required for sulfatase activity
MPPITPGQQFGRYVIRAKLGTGGMGEVYLADDVQLGRHVALKFLARETETDVIAQRRLLREARSAATLDHPHICSVYEVGEIDGRPYIAMQFVEGETLDARMRRTPLELIEILSIAVHIADALSDAHAHDILHRDIKPANIMVTPRGDAKVMDFGLATHPSHSGPAVDQAETASVLTGRGVIVGTVAYMSPEQARAEALDSRSDLFSLGVMLYEMVSGQRPFPGASTAEITVAILMREPAPLARYAPNTPVELERIVTKLLNKRTDSRYQTAKDLLIDLRTLREECEFQHRLERTPRPPGQMVGESTPKATDPATVPVAASSGTGGTTAGGSSWRAIIVGVVALAALVAGGGYARRTANVRWARAQLERLPALADAKRYAEAYEIASALEPYLPGDTTLASVMTVVSDTVSVTTEPEGASVYLKRFTGDAAPAARHLIGTSPMKNVRIARGEYILSIEKEGYAPTARTVSGVVIQAGALAIKPPPIRIAERLAPAGNVPPRMVFVPGGDYRLIAWSRPTDRRTRLDDYFIDQYEVSNQEFKEFISAGGYGRREFWTHPFIKDGRVVPWDDAQRLFVDRTGLPGPRTWSNQGFPDGKADYPVTDITWYEADAYAAFRGKRLPTIFQWEKAARNGYQAMAGVGSMPWGAFYPGDPLKDRANFGPAPLPITSAEFGMSAFGAYNMAGNVAEWTANDSSDGYLATGGAWGDPVYTFSQFGGRPGLFSSEKLGFRCVRSSAASSDQGGGRVELAREVPQFSAPTATVFAGLAALYRYEKVPLDARIEQTVETPEWTREKISFNGGNGTRAMAYLYLPNHVRRPLQVVQLLPAGDVAGGFRSLADAMDDRMTPFVRAGRAAFGVVLDGYTERLQTSTAAPPSADTVEFSERTVWRITDLRRGLDYLETRSDIDMTRIGALAPSAGSLLGIILGAIENRYRTFVFIGAGFPVVYRAIHATSNPINFASYIRAPKLVLQGRYDEDTPLRTQTAPFFKLLIEPKRLTLYDGGHVPSVEVTMAEISPWLDDQLGRVVR